jgi:uncharacterized protein DUF3306
MSEPDGFLTRWSRRKREATQAASEAQEASLGAQESGAHASGAHASGAHASGTQASGAQAPAGDTEMPVSPPTTQGPAAEPPSLPPIESIEAGTDIRAYLGKEVAPDLARAALRRAWLADPAIRDFVGLADYDWDFNAPDRMAGFGPLRPTDDVRQLLAHMLGSETAGPKPTEPSEAEGGQATADGPAADCHDAAKGAESDKQTTKPRHVGVQSDTNASPTNEEEMAGKVAAPQYSEAIASNLTGPVARRHGRALPE